MASNINRSGENQPSYLVRPARLDDLPGFRALAIDIFEHDFGYGHGYQPQIHHPDPLDEEDFKAYFEPLKQHALFVATEGATGRLLGTAAVKSVRPGLAPDAPDWLVERFDRPTTAEIVRVYVDRGSRRRGIGRALLAAALAYIDTVPVYTAVYLHTDAGYPGAEAFWTSHGVMQHDNRGTVEGSRTLFFEIPWDRRPDQRRADQRA